MKIYSDFEQRMLFTSYSIQEASRKGAKALEHLADSFKSDVGNFTLIVKFHPFTDLPEEEDSSNAN